MIVWAYPAMVEVAETILETGRSKEVEDKNKVMSVKKILNLINE
jgi:hypothetical protein